MTGLQKQLCNILQDGLPVCQRPFVEIAKILDSDEKTVLQQVSELRDIGIIRRLNALVNYRAIGKAGTLVAGHVPQENLRDIIAVVNSMEGVSHNYLRQHYYNLWFTLQAESTEQIGLILSNLSARFGIDFYGLPVERVFKLDVRFDAEAEGQTLVRDVADVQDSDIIELNEKQKIILSGLQKELEIIAEPFDFLCGDDFKIREVLEIIQYLIIKGVIRRIAAIVDHRRLGFTANVLFACKVEPERIVMPEENWLITVWSATVTSEKR